MSDTQMNSQEEAKFEKDYRKHFPEGADIFYNQFVEKAVTLYPDGQHQEIVQQLNEKTNFLDADNNDQRVIYALNNDLVIEFKGEDYTLSDLGFTKGDLQLEKPVSKYTSSVVQR